MQVEYSNKQSKERKCTVKALCKLAFFNDFSTIPCCITLKSWGMMILRRTILKHQLAIKLYPDSINVEAAMQLLRKEIRNTKELKRKLFSEHVKSNTHYYTHKQLEILLEHYCITPQEFKQL